MQNFTQNGKTMPFTAGAAISAGDVVAVERVVGVSVTDVANGAEGTLELEGVFTLPKTPGQTWAQGDALYWNPAGPAFTNVAADNLLFAGFAFASATSGATTGSVKLSGANNIYGNPGEDSAAMLSGKLTVAGGGTTGTASPGAAYNGKPVMATVEVAGSTPAYVVSAIVAAGTLTVTLSADPTTDATVAYFIDGRA